MFSADENETLGLGRKTTQIECRPHYSLSGCTQPPDLPSLDVALDHLAETVLSGFSALELLFRFPSFNSVLRKKLRCQPTLPEWGSGSPSLEASSKYLHGLFGIFLHERSVSSPHDILSPCQLPLQNFLSA